MAWPWVRYSATDSVRRFTSTMRVLVITLTMTVIMATAGGAYDEEERLTSRLIDLLSTLATTPEAIPGISVKGRVIEIGKHSVRIAPVSEQVLKADEKYISAAHFEIYLDGVRQDQLTSGSVGIGDSADEATTLAVEEWYFLSGLALLRSIADTASDHTHGGFRVYPGSMGVRGQPPKGFEDGKVINSQKVLNAISDALPRADGKLHFVQVLVVVGPDSPISGDCRIDGKVSAKALSLLKDLRWPKTDGNYMYKQSYVLK